MKKVFFLMLCASVFMFTSCSKDTPAVDETADLVQATSQIQGPSNTAITVVPNCNSFTINTGSKCGTGLLLKYQIYDTANNIVDANILVMSGSSYQTPAILSPCTDYRLVAEALPCNGTDAIRTTIGCNGGC